MASLRALPSATILLHFLEHDQQSMDYVATNLHEDYNIRIVNLVNTY